MQDQLAKLESRAARAAPLILSESDRQSIDKFRGDMLATRRELREVKRALREDIDRLDGWLKFANIALVRCHRHRRSGGRPAHRRRTRPSD